MNYFSIAPTTHPASVALFVSMLRNRGFKSWTEASGMLATQATLPQINTVCGEQNEGWVYVDNGDSLNAEREANYQASL